MIPFFSIVIPTYNRSLLVCESVRSVLNQSFEDYEIIVVDDGSTDDTTSAVKTISSDKLFYFKKENGERGAARNYGINKAKGKYVVFMDSDDCMEQNHLMVLHTHLKQQQEDFVATKYFFFNEESKFIAADIKRLSEGNHNFNTFLIGNPLACCFAIRRENADLILFKEELKYTIMEDWIFLMENLQKSRLYIINEFTMGMRDHDLRSMKGSSEKIINARINALTYLKEKITFSPKDLKVLEGSSDYFCAVHYYIGRNRKAGLHYLSKSVKSMGISLKSVLLFLKLCLR